jgi:hypothetical protein
MSVRATMSDLIARVSLMIADPSNVTISQQYVQDKLDEGRRDLWQAILTPKITYLNPGGFAYNDYYYIPSGNPRDKAKGFFEANEVLVWGDWTILTPTTSDELVGHWTFSAGQFPPVLIRGRRFDIYRAAADLLDEKIAALAATAIDFTSDGQSFHLSQQVATLEKMRDSYRRKQEAISYHTQRLDSAESGGDESSGIQPRQGSLVGSVSAGVPFLTGP